MQTVIWISFLDLYLNEKLYASVNDKVPRPKVALENLIGCSVPSYANDSSYDTDIHPFVLFVT